MAAAAWGAPLPAGLQGACPYTVLGLCISEGSPSVSVKDAAVDEAAVKSREALTLKAIGTAYRKAALRAHPDKNKGREEAAAADFIKVSLAFAFLSDQAQRESYHRHLRALLSLRLQREQHKQRWSSLDEQRQRFKADLEFREAAARQGPKQNAEEETLRRIREQNEELLRQKQQQLSEATCGSFRLNSTQQQQQQQHQGQAKGAPDVRGEDATDEAGVGSILSRSLLFSWNSSAAAAAAAAQTEGELSADKQPAAAAAAAAPAAAAAAAPSPSSLAAEFRDHGAVDLCFFSVSRGLACVSFASRERAIESALLLQGTRRSSKKTGSGGVPKLPGLKVKLADRAPGFARLLQQMRAAADPSEGPPQKAAVAAGSPLQQARMEAAAAPSKHNAHAKEEGKEEEKEEGKEERQEDAADADARLIARETEEAAAAFAAALAAPAGGAAATPAAGAAAAGTGGAAREGSPSVANFAADRGSLSPPEGLIGVGGREGELSAFEARAAAAAFGLMPGQTRQQTSCAAARILAYVRSCSERGEAEARKQQQEKEGEEEWRWQKRRYLALSWHFSIQEDKVQLIWTAALS
ncbi:hypothetical protein Efla_000636 [Eimeria flavescens]